jgi:DNA (cytosine-5)-methyltransferase 1
MNNLTAIDLFSGCGGLTLGLKQAGFRVIAAIEKDDLAVSTYKSNHPQVRVFGADICTVRPQPLMQEFELKPGELDLLAGCPPCQGFSVLRTRNGATQRRDTRNGLITEILRFAQALQPKAIMLENVPGLGEHWSFRKLCRDLRKLGYVVEWDVKDARHYGVPQRRKRLILVAGRGFKIPFAKESNKIKTVRDAIGHLDVAGKSRDKLHNIPEKRSAKVQSLIRAIPKDGGSRTDLPRSRQL